MSIISFICFKTYLYFIAYWIFAVISTILLFYFNKYEEETGEEIPIKEDNVLLLIYYNISDLLTGILVLISKQLRKSTEKEEVKEKQQPRYELIYNDNNIVYLKKRTILLIALISIFYFVGQSSSCFFVLIFSRKTNKTGISLFNFTQLIFKIILSRYFLKLMIYKHHIVSMIILIIGFLPLFIVEMKNIINVFEIYKYENLFDILFLVLEIIGMSLGETLSKITFNKHFIFPEKLIFYRGILTLLIHCFIIVPILYFSGQIHLYKNIILFFSESSAITILANLLYFFFIFIKNIITMKVIYFYSPIHTSFLNSIFYYFICMISYSPIDDFTLLEIILYTISIMLIIFGALLFCEIIIINKYGLNNHTKYGFLETEQLGRDTFSEEQENIEINEDYIIKMGCKS